MLEQFITELAVNKDKEYVLYDQSDEAICIRAFCPASFLNLRYTSRFPLEIRLFCCRSCERQPIRENRLYTRGRYRQRQRQRDRKSVV